MKKCLVMVNELLFLSFLVGQEGIRMDPKKTNAVDEWLSLSTITETQSFMGLAFFYRKFIRNFGSITTAITDCS